MNSTKKFIVAASLFLQLAGSLEASYNLTNWSNAALSFAGGSDPVAAANYVLNNGATTSAGNALTIANTLGTAEGMATALFMTNGKQSVFTSALNKMNSSFQASDVQAAMDAIAGLAPVKSAPIAGQAPVAQAPATSAWSWLTGASSAAPTFSQADIQNAEMAQQQADVAAATANNQALSSIAASGQSGVNLYNAYVNQMFTLLQEAVAAIPIDAAGTQQQVVQHIQANAANMSASVKSNQYNSRTLGRMNSNKKASRKAKNNRK